MPKRKNTAIKPYKLKSGKKRYMFYIYLGQKAGKKVQTVRRGFKSYDEADAAYKKLAAQDPNEFVKSKQYTLDELYKMWLPFYEPNVKPSTLAMNQQMYDTHIKPHFGNQYIDQITTADIADYFLKLSKQLVRYKSVFYLLRRLLEYAIDTDVLNRNPARSSLLPKKTAKKRKDKSKNFYSAEEVQKFLSAAKSKNAKAYLYFLILVSTGMRRNEALGLDWNDIDYDQKRIYVQRTTAYDKNKNYITQLPKNGKKRYVPLTDRLSHELKKYRHDLTPKIFHNSDGEYLQPATVQAWLVKIYDENPDLRKITIHGFRHTFATLLNSAGINPKDIQEILGHSKIDLTLNIYTHSTEEGRETARQQINELF